MSDAMDAEFDTVAEWTAEVALDLGPEHRLPAACRGSGSPAALDWLLDNLAVTQGETVLDCGAGVGGPAAYLAERIGARPVLLEPAHGACRAAQRLFGLPVVRADAGALPFHGEQFEVVWSLGVLCTTPQQSTVLAEARRVLHTNGRLGLLVYVAARSDLDDQPEGNHFPTEAALADLVRTAGFDQVASEWLTQLPAASSGWQQREAEVDAELERRHGRNRAWRSAQEQSGRMSALIEKGDVAGLLLVARPS